MKALGYVSTPVTEHHRWTPYSRRPIANQHSYYSHVARRMLHQMRWRRPPRQPVLTVVSVLMSLLVHAIGLSLWLLARPPLPPEPAPLGQANAIQVRFIESHPAPRPPPIPAVPAPVRAPRVAKQSAAPPARAPRRAPLPVVPREQPHIRVKVTPRKVAVARPVVPAPRVAPVPVPKIPAPPLPPVAAPPPPKLTLEKTPMSVPPPRITLTQATPVKAATPAIGTPRPRIELQRPRVATIRVPDQDVTIAAVPEVKVTPTPTPAAKPPPLPAIAASVPVAVSPVTLPTTPAVSVPATPPPAVAASIASVTPAPAASQVLPAAPLSAPEVTLSSIQAPPAPQVQAPTVALASVARLASTSPAPARSAPAPARAVSVVTPSPAPAQASWAQQSDTFSKKPLGPPGQGTAERSQAAKGSPNGVPAYVQRLPQGNSDVMTRRYKGFTYRRTIFDQYWAPANEDLLTSMLRRLVDALSFHKTINLGHGVRIHCGGWLLGFGCGGDPPDPMSKMSNDRRLNMAPAKPLVPGMGASAPPPPPAPPPESSHQQVQCETARVAGAPLPPGCPTEGGNTR